MTVVKKTFNLTFYLIIFSLLLLCIYGMYSAFTRGIASAWYYKADFALNDWSEQGKIQNENQYFDTLAAITKAQYLDDSHPHYAHILGRIIHWGVNNGFEKKERLIDVKAWYLLSTELRPLWPDPWIDLAQLNNNLAGYTPDTQYYLNRALEAGPYIPLVTSGVLKVLLLNWAILPGEDKARLFEQFSIATTQRNGLRQALHFAKSIGQEKLLCIQVKFNPIYRSQKKSSLYKKYCR
jgi:hypothetical protein